MVKQPMTVTVNRPSADVAVVKIAGDIGLGQMVGDDGKHSGVSGDTVLEEKLRLAVPEPVKLVVVDLTDATYLSSLGIGTLLRLRNRIVPPGEFRMAANGNLVVLLKHGRLDQLFKIFPTVNDAIAG